VQQKSVAALAAEENRGSRKAFFRNLLGFSFWTSLIGRIHENPSHTALLFSSATLVERLQEEQQHPGEPRGQIACQ
jgi:hypothetical protein